MAFFEWDESLSVGVPMIDSDHQILISLINQLHEALDDAEARATMGSVLNALVDYTEYHFKREEKAMEVVGYPDLEAHKERHRKLERQVDEIRQRYARESEAAVGQDLLDFLKEWLQTHIRKEDMRYRSHVIDRPEAISAAEEVSFVDLGGLDDVEEAF